MFRRSTLCLLIGFCVLAHTNAHAANDAPTAEVILKATDDMRNPGRPTSMVSTLTEFRDGAKQQETVLTIFSKPDGATGGFRTLVRFEMPARDHGKLMLSDGDQYWFFDPASQASVRLSPQQRLMGQASDGDVMLSNYGTDYAGILSGEEQIGDAEGNKRNCWKLILAPHSSRALYAKIELWVEKETLHPMKARFYADSGRLLKTLFYRNFAMELGKVRPTQVLIVDGVDTQLVTRIDLSNWQSREIPDSWFDVSFLPRVGVE